ncbi:MAG: HDIG domain-containing protein, partial [Bacteroidales bacterium]|nr:HDIG domain-containing protein [Bacteroidales bacterium]
SEKAIIIDGNIAREVPFTSIVTVSDIPELIIERLRNNPEIDSTLFVRSIYRSLQHNLFFDSVLTDNDLIDRLSEIVPVNGLIQQDERIITKGEIVDREKYQVLLSLKAEYEDQLKGSTYYFGILAGQIILVTIALLAMVLFLIFFRKDVWRSYKKIVLINCIILLMVGITAITVRTHVDWIYLVPLCLAPIIIRVFFDTGMAIFVHIITVILIGFLVPNSFEYVFFQLIAGIITIVSVRDLQKRSQFFMTSLFIFLTYIFLMIGFTLIQHGSLAEINSLNLAMFGGSALLTLFAYPFIFIIEKGFNMTTDISLLEYADTNSKLLRRLANEAPGTFQHAIQVANLAEEAIRYIGGNALLTRAGALYHDIGKLYNPAFFTENQTVGNNPHDKLSYKESVNILRNHVTKGISMAKKHKLPVQIIDFIKTHHGTKKADYFFLKYKEDHPGDTIDESEFRYPGPEPFSKETAVVMMADAVEAASRSMKQPDKKQIDSLVENLIDKQLAENQYSFSAITLGEISKVKAIFKKRLMNIYHLRVEYPDEKKEK